MQNLIKYVIIKSINLHDFIFMKNLNKILVIFILFSCFYFNSVFADLNKSDCGTFWVLEYNNTGQNWFDIVNSNRETTSSELTNFLSIDQQRAIITKDDLNTAILNLKKYCCEAEKWWLKQKDKTCKNDEIFFNDNALESEFLFNHLFDVIMRRLSWLNWDNDIYKKSKMSIDDSWLKRRELINSQAESPKWASPQTISTEYNRFRTQSTPDKWYDINDLIDWEFSYDDITFLRFVSWQWEWEYTNNSKKVAKALWEYENRTLYDRYKNSCALAEYFYILLGWGKSSDKETLTRREKDWFLWVGQICNNFIDNQISSENKYVQSVVKRSSNLFMSNYIQWYMSYMYERQMKLQKLWKECGDRFLDTVRAVPCLINNCVQ